MQRIISSLGFKIGALLVVLLAAALFIAPRVQNNSLADTLCPNAPQVATMNPFPKSSPRQTCNDWPTLFSKKNGQFPPSASQLDINATAGEEFLLLSYVHNGAVQGSEAARDINVRVTVSDTVESQHVVGATITSENAGGAVGSFSVFTGPNDRLEIVSAHVEDWFGSRTGDAANITTAGGEPVVDVHFNQMEACFEFSKFVVIRVRVVTQAEPAEPVSSISAQLGNRIAGQCLFDGTVTWSTQNVQNARVFVVDQNGTETLFAAEEGATRNTPWLNPNNTYRFVLRGDNIAQKEAAIVTPNLDCGPPAPQPVATLNASLGNRIAGQCLFDGTVTWSTQNVQNVRVYVVDPITGAEGLLAAQESGTRSTPWLAPSRSYKFILRGDNIPAQEKTIVTPNLDCTPPPVVETVTCSVNPQSARVGELVTFAADKGNGIYSWTVNGGSIRSFNSRSFSTTFSSVGTYTATVTSNNQSASCQVVITAVPPSFDPVVCSVSPSTVTTNQAVTFTADRGNGSYSWTVNGGIIPSFTGRSFSTVFSNPGTFTATVASNGRTANCQVVVNPQPVVHERVTCAVSPQAIVAGQSATFTADRGNNIYSWSVNGGSVTSSSARSFSSVFNTAGTFTAIVTSNGLSANCSVQVNPQPVVHEPVTCSVNPATITAGQATTFSADRGNGSYSWTVNGGSITSTSSRIFSSFFNTPGTYRATVTSAGRSASCDVVVTAAPANQLICQVVGASTVQTGQPVSFNATGGTGAYAFNAPGGNPASQWTGSLSTFSTRYSVAGTYIVKAISGSQMVDCPSVVVTNPAPPACVINVGSLSHNGITQIGTSNVYRATINYTFSGSHPVKVTYIDPADNQEKVFVASATSSGSQAFTSILPNRNYIFKLYDLSDCGGVIHTLVIRKDVNNQCISNSNFALNYTTPVKSGSFYSTVLTWSSTGANQIKIARGNTSNIIATGSQNGQVTAGSLTAGNSYTFYMIDSACGTILTTLTIVIPAEQPPVIPPATTTTTTATNIINNNVTGNNNNTVSNNTIVTGNNNTVTNTNTCVNNSCNTNIVYISTTGATVPANELRQLNIEKLVRLPGGSYQNTVTANTNDTVEFQITVRNSGNQPVNNVRVTDNLPSGLSFMNGSFNGGSATLGTLQVNETRILTFQARVTATENTSVQNIAVVSGDSVSQVQDDAWVFVRGGQVAGGSVNLAFSKKAFNETKNVDAVTVPASKEDFITYTLTVTNTGNAPAANFVITDDLSQVLPYADMVDRGGGNLSGNVITYPGITIPAGGSVSKSFKVRVKYFLADNLSYVMSNTYGNTVTVRINTPQVQGAFVAPKTGANTVAFSFAGMLTAGFALYRKREFLTRLILA